MSQPLPLRLYLREVWARRDFVMQMPLGRLRAQTGDTNLGAVWHVLNPLLFAAVYYLVFGVLFDARRAIPDFEAFLVTGLFVFQFTRRVATAGARSIVANRNLVTQLMFPRVALPLSATIGESMSHGLVLAALVLILPIMGQAPMVSWLLLIPVVILQASFNLGLAMILARAAFHLRDLQNLLPHVLRIWMYLSGLFFSADVVASRLGASTWAVAALEVNPAYTHMSLARGAMLASQPLDGHLWLVAAAWSALALILGLTYFRRREVEYSRV